MPKVTLTDIQSGSGVKDTYNANNDVIEQAFDNTLSRNGATPNGMLADLDMNSKKAINLGDGVNNQDAVTLRQLNNAISSASTGLIAVQLETKLGSDANGSNKFTLTGVTYYPGVNNLAVYMNGQRLRRVVDYTETSETEVTLTFNPPDDAMFDFIINEATTSNVQDGSGVTFTPEGTGAVATNVQDKLRESVSILDFGAVPGTDCTAAFNLAATYCQDNFKALYIPGSTSEYWMGECDVITKRLEIHGDGVDHTLIRPIQGAADSMWVFNGTAEESHIRDMKITRENGTINIGVAVQTYVPNFKMTDVEFVHAGTGVYISTGFYYHVYRNVKLRNTSGFLHVDVGDNNNNNFYDCYFDTLTMEGANGVNFFGCDFSPVQQAASPCLFINPHNVNFYGCYCEQVNNAYSGTYDVFHFRADSPDPIGQVNIYSMHSKGISGESEGLFHFDGVKGAVYGGYSTSFTYISKLTNGAEVTHYSVSKQSGIQHFQLGQMGTILEHGTIRMATRVSDPIAQGDPGLSINTSVIEVNASDAGASDATLKSNKAANGSSTRHQAFYSAGTLAGTVEIDGNNEIRLVAKAASGRACLVETGGQRLDVLSNYVRPSTDGSQACGGEGNRWSHTYTNILALKDGVTAPATMAGHAVIYVDSSNGDLMVRFSDGTLKTIVVDT